MYSGDGFDKTCYCVDVGCKEKEKSRMTPAFLT